MFFALIQGVRQSATTARIILEIKINSDFCVREQICQRLGFWPAGKINVCNLRILGYCFNPITPFFVYNEAGEMVGYLLKFIIRPGPSDVCMP